MSDEKNMSGSKPSPEEGRLDAYLRARPLPEPGAWFTARTLARLRNERQEGWFARFVNGLFRRRRTAAALLLALTLAGAGWTTVQRHTDQKLTFAALELAAQGEAPFTDEETTWPETSF
jgi:hypothetical protein